MLDLYDQIQAAAAAIRSQWDGQPYAGIILGTGLGSLVEQIDVEATIDYDDDQGRRRYRDRTGGSAYALATALHIRYGHVWQGEATASVMPTVTRRTPPADIGTAARIARALGVWNKGMTAQAAAEATAAALDDLYQNIGMPSRLRELQIPRGELPLLASDTLKNFNANPGDRPEDYTAQMLDLLHAAW